MLPSVSLVFLLQPVLSLAWGHGVPCLFHCGCIVGVSSWFPLDGTTRRCSGRGRVRLRGPGAGPHSTQSSSSQKPRIPVTHESRRTHSNNAPVEGHTTRYSRSGVITSTR